MGVMTIFIIVIIIIIIINILIIIIIIIIFVIWKSFSLFLFHAQCWRLLFSLKSS